MTTEPILLAQEYLAAPPNAFWCWSADGQALETRHHKTIVLRAELGLILKRIAPGGLPPFGSIVLLLAACRDNWPEINRDLSNEFLNRMSVSMGGLKDLAQTHDILAALDALHQLPAELRKGVEVKSLIAQIVFENANRINRPLNAKEAVAIARALQDDTTDRTWASAKKNPSVSQDLLGDLNALNGGVQLLNEYRLRMLLRTGLDAVPEPLDLDDVEDKSESTPKKPQRTIRDLLDELAKQPEHAGLARLTQDLMAALYVPRALNHPQELPLGGFSDISNRGPLDRLLVSELAHEDLVLSARLAMNEALYLRREAPPQPPPTTRAILLDSGIRMWGIPRVFACAAGLAFHALAPKNMNVVAYRAFGEGISPTELKTREGLERHLEALSPAPHPARAVEIFLESLRSEFSNQADTSGLEAIFITHPAVIEDTEFRAALQTFAQFDQGRAFLVTVNRDGQFRFFSLHARGKKLIREAVLPLEKILNAEKPKAKQRGERPQRAIPLRAPAHDPNRPWLLTMEPLPLRLPNPVDPARACYSKKHGLATVTRDGRLTLWQKKQFGPQELTSRLPTGALHTLWFQEDTVCVLKGLGRGQLSLIRVTLENQKSIQIKLPVRNEPILGAGAIPGAIFVSHRHEVDLFDPNLGVKLSSLNLEGRAWRHGRFFRGRNGWELLAYNGMNARFIPVPSPPTLKEVRTQEVTRGVNPPFEREGLDGPWYLTSDGNLYSLGDNQFSFKKILPNGAHMLHGISKDGHVLQTESMLKGDTKFCYMVVDLEQGNSQRYEYPQGKDVLESRRANIHFQQLTRFANIGGVALSEDKKELLFRNRSSAWFRIREITRQAEQRKLSVSRLTGAVPQAYVQFFRQASTPETGFSVKRATFKSGSMIYYDSRGLLHLKSYDPEIPELALSLNLDEVAGWSPETGSVGASYLSGKDGRGSFDVFLSYYWRFLETLA